MEAVELAARGWGLRLTWIGGGMASESLLKGYNVYKVPENLSDEDAALVEPTAVAVYGVERGGVKAGDSVLVTGAGPIGLLTLLAARAAGRAGLPPTPTAV